MTYCTVPTFETIAVDGFATCRKDNVGITMTFIGYGTYGRIAPAGFTHGDAEFLWIGYQFETTFANSGARIAVFGRGRADVNIQIA